MVMIILMHAQDLLKWLKRLMSTRSQPVLVKLTTDLKNTVELKEELRSGFLVT